LKRKVQFNDVDPDKLLDATENSDDQSNDKKDVSENVDVSVSVSTTEA